MSREEEIQKAAKIFYASSDDYTFYNRGFEEGAKWSDQHPRKGLWDADKVIKWLRANIDNYANYNVKTDECFVNDFEEDLIKAMED